MFMILFRQIRGEFRSCWYLVVVSDKHSGSDYISEKADALGVETEAANK